MVIKDILDEFTAAEKEAEKKRKTLVEQKKLETEELLSELHECFESTILPVLNEAIHDLKETGYYHKMEIGRVTSLESQKKYIIDITVYFFPTIIRNPKFLEASFIRDYRLFFSTAKGYRGIKISKKIGANEDVTELVIHKVDKTSIQSYVREFVKDSILDFKST